MTTGAYVEILEDDHEPGTGVVAMRVVVNGVDVGTLARAPKVSAGDGVSRMATVTLVLVPSRVDVKGSEAPTSSGFKIGFDGSKGHESGIATSTEGQSNQT